MDFIGKYCLLRTYSAGVHIGILRQFHGTHAVLEGARRIWKWNGANTLNELSKRGVSKPSKISEKVDKIMLTQVIEIFECTQEAKNNLDKDQWKE